MPKQEHKQSGWWIRTGSTNVTPSCLFDKTTLPLHKLVALGGLCLYVFLPYWRLLGAKLYVNALLLIVSLLAISGWHVLSRHDAIAKDERIVSISGLTKLDYIYCTLISVALLIYQLKFLLAPIAWRGDEDSHIYFTLKFQAYLSQALRSNSISIISLLLLWVIGYFVSKKFSLKNVGWLFWLSLCLAIAVIISPVVMAPAFLSLRHRLLRYPPLMLVAETIFANRLFSTTHVELAHRMSAFIPYVTIFWLSYLMARSYGIKPPLLYLLPVVLPVTPLLYYYGSIVYIELLVVLIQFWVLFKIFNQRKVTRQFLFEIAVTASVAGVIKESAVPFLLAVLGYLVWKIFSDRQGLYQHKLLLSLSLAYVTFLPVLIYLSFRLAGGDPRPYSAQFGNIFKLGTYITYSLAVKQQIALIPALISGLGLLFFLCRGKRKMWLYSPA